MRRNPETGETSTPRDPKPAFGSADLAAAWSLRPPAARPLVVRGELDGAAFTILLREEALTASWGDRLVVACDRAGRLYSFWRAGHTYRRGLNGRVLHKWQDEAGRHWEWLDEAGAEALVDGAAALFRRLHDTVKAGPVRFIAHPEPTPLDRVVCLAALELGARFTAAVARADAARFAGVYAPIGILPPDQYLALVVQGTIGCSFDTCTFCDLFGQRYRVKTPIEFATHVEDVRAYLGPSLSLRRRSIFFGSANALAVPIARLVEHFDILVRELDAKTRGVGAFVDGFTGLRKTTADFLMLAERGLRRVYIGLESGHDPLLAFVRKPATARQAIETVRAAKAAGVSAGVIVMVGLGGDRFADAHVADTIAAVNAMALGPTDVLYFSELVEIPGTPYPVLAAQEGLRALSPGECRAQRRRIREGLRFVGAPPKITSYNIREFVY